MQFKTVSEIIKSSGKLGGRQSQNIGKAVSKEDECVYTHIIYLYITSIFGLIQVTLRTVDGVEK